jgi:hypothetical protein
MKYGLMSYYRLGATWPRRRLREYYPEVTRRARRRRLGIQSSNTVEPPEPVPMPGGSTIHKPLIQRHPTARSVLRRFTEVQAQITNSLLGLGHIIQTGAGDQYRIGFAPIRAPRAPNNNDDVTVQGVVPGVVWINTIANTAFICVDHTQNAAIWVGPIS